MSVGFERALLRLVIAVVIVIGVAGLGPPPPFSAPKPGEGGPSGPAAIREAVGKQLEEGRWPHLYLSSSLAFTDDGIGVIAAPGSDSLGSSSERCLFVSSVRISHTI